MHLAEYQVQNYASHDAFDLEEKRQVHREKHEDKYRFSQVFQGNESRESNIYFLI